MDSTVLPNIALIWIAVFVSGCATPNKPYWMTSKTGEVASQKPADVFPGKFHDRLAIVEFDEQGDLWSQSQLNEAREMIRKSPKIPLLVVYIHGWQNNAHPKNSDLDTFNKLITKLAENPSVKSKFTVNGVFIGWRGASFLKEADYTGIGWLLRQTSFWSRKAATDRMAGVPLTGTLAKLSASARTAQQGRGVTVFIGHSFGGRILERALGQSIVSQYAFTDKRHKADLPADLTILINPAAESLYARGIKLALSSYPENARPAVISITADTDSATKIAWPAGVGLATAFGGFRKYPLANLPAESQRSYVIQTAGHDNRMPTHIIRSVPDAKPITDEAAFSYNLREGSENLFYITSTDSAAKGQSLRDLDKKVEGKGKWMLPHGGYWVMNVPADILEGHGGVFAQRGIFSDQIIDLLGALFKITNARNIAATPQVDLRTQSEAPVEPTGEESKFLGLPSPVMQPAKAP